MVNIQSVPRSSKPSELSHVCPAWSTNGHMFNWGFCVKDKHKAASSYGAEDSLEVVWNTAVAELSCGVEMHWSLVMKSVWFRCVKRRKHLKQTWRSVRYYEQSIFCKRWLYWWCTHCSRSSPIGGAPRLLIAQLRFLIYMQKNSAF